MSRTRGSRSAERGRLHDLSPALLARVLASVDDVVDLARLNAVSRLFRGAPIEQALRARAKARGQEGWLPESLPPDVATWTEELFARERVWLGARAHAHVVAAGGRIYPGASVSGFSALIDASGRLHTFGEDKDYAGNEGSEDDVRAIGQGALGHGEATSPVACPRLVAALSGVRVTAVACGPAHLLALAASGELYACGDNGCGQLGLGAEASEVRVPTLVEALRHEHIVLVDASTCGNSSVAVTAGGRVFAFGDNSSGQLGLGFASDYELHERGWRVPGCVRTPTLVAGLAHTRVVAVAMGGEHCLALSADGSVFSWGEGRMGSLGHDSIATKLVPTRIVFLKGVRVVAVCAGSCHSLLVDDAGGVHAFGNHNLGALGLGKVERATDKPRRIEALAAVRIVRACAANQVSLFVSADGDVYSCGMALYTLLGHDGWRPTQDILSGLKDAPVRIEPLRLSARGQRVVDIAAGEFHVLAVTADGRLHAYGRHSGALGLGLSILDCENMTVVPARHVPSAPAVALPCGR